MQKTPDFYRVFSNDLICRLDIKATFLYTERNIRESILSYNFFLVDIEMTVNDAVAKRVVNLLAEKNMTQYRLEQNSGIQHGHMQWIMSGKSKTVTLSTVIMLATGFDMTLIEFLDDELFSYENLEVE